MTKKFKLESVLNYRQLLENQAQQLLADSFLRKTNLETELQQQQEQLLRHDSELKRLQQDGLTIAEIELYETQIYHCRRVTEKLQRELAQLDRQIVGEREELLAAARDRQVIEKLKEKQQAEYARELSRKEREMLDEISLRNKGENT